MQTVPYLQPRDFPTPHSATAVQATAYALLVYLRNDWFREAQPIMSWLQTQRDTPSGFISSQVRRCQCDLRYGAVGATAGTALSVRPQVRRCRCGLRYGAVDAASGY